MDTVLSDLRYALRTLRKSPTFAIVAVVTLALGIGANTVIFSLVDAVVIRALPYADPDRVAVVWEDNTPAGFSRNTPAPANYFDWRRMNRSFTDMAATRGSTTSLTGGSMGSYVTCGSSMEPVHMPEGCPEGTANACGQLDGCCGEGPPDWGSSGVGGGSSGAGGGSSGVGGAGGGGAADAGTD